MEFNVEKEELTSYVSPIKALWINFRFNQFFGICPARINENWTQITIVKKMILLTFSIKAMLLALILALVHIWLGQQGLDFPSLLSRLYNYPKFTSTDTFAMAAHFLFLQISALAMFINNLGMYH